MDWMKLIVPLIVVAIWIVGSLARQQRETRLPRMPPARVPPPRPRNPLDPLMRDDAQVENSYRGELEQQRQKRPLAAKSAAKLRPKRNEPKPRLPTRLAPAAVLVETPKTLGAIPVPPPQRDVVVVETVAAKIVTPGTPIVPSAPAAIKNMRALLKNSDSLVTAFLLKEVLDLPLAKRPRRRK